ncbi:MAG TPA: O-antigen ligase family protein [Opitutaceae bacterium]|nr:O-antigen ligase family protein [Opitutaceae bacterium]
MNRAWLLLLDFACLCVSGRFVIASLHCEGRDFGAILVLLLGTTLLAFLSSSEILFSVAALIAFINGCGATHILPSSDPIALTLSGIFIGTFVRDRAIWHLSSGPLRPISLVSQLLAGGVIASLIFTLAASPAKALQPSQFLRIPVFGYSEPLYPLTTTLIWIQGLSYFQLLLFRCKNKIPALYTTFGLLTAACVCYCVWQAATGYPVPWSPQLKHFSPFEDIHAFGGVAVALLGFSFALLVNKEGRMPGYISAAWVVLTLAMTALSFSRSAWLAAVSTIVLVTAVRFGWRRAALGVAALFLICLALWPLLVRYQQQNIYAARAASLIRFEAIEKKIPERLALYERALRMIESHPITGVGIGRSYEQSTYYADLNDPIRQIPNFSHDAILQFAAEMGIPLALCLGSLCGFILFSSLKSLARDPRILAIYSAAFAFCLTQLSSNSINIYSGQQTFLWFLLAGTAVSTVSNHKEKSLSGII